VDGFCLPKFLFGQSVTGTYLQDPIQAQRFCDFGQFQEQTTRLLLLSWYLHLLVVIPILVKRVFIRFKLRWLLGRGRLDKFLDVIGIIVIIFIGVFWTQDV